VGGGRGRTVREELEGIGIVKDGKEGKDHAGGGRDAVVVDASWDTGVRMGAHFELHIEQGPHLVDAGEKVGVVEGVQAYRWYEVDFQGRDCHTGTTSFAHRADALLAAARAIVDVRALSEEVGKGALASVGIIEAKPGSVNTVPGYVRMSLDLRCPNEQTLDELEAKVMRSLKATTAAAAAAADRPTHAGNASVRVEIKETFRSGAVRFQTGAVDCVEAAARSVLRCAGAAAEQGKTLVRRMTSGAGHDSIFASKRCPTAMIFVPCKGGVSHHPEEWCEKDDCATGASVLTEAVLRFDRTREHGAEI
jgi:hydantoinase/carbamoylase family amidase